MAYDEGLAERLREILQDRPGMSEAKMFGGLAFMSRGHMVCGVIDDALIARVGQERYADALTQPHVRPMDLTGKPMKGFVVIDPPGIAEDAALAAWVQCCYRFVQTLPAKAPGLR